MSLTGALIISGDCVHGRRVESWEGILVVNGGFGSMRGVVERRFGVLLLFNEPKGLLEVDQAGS